MTPIDEDGDIELTDDGDYPGWSLDGRYIYYLRTGSKELFRKSVTSNPVFAITGNEQLVFQNQNHTHFDLLSDGTVLLTQPEGAQAEGGETWVILNFNDEMERIAPRSR